jgi:hypothetical protein
VISYLLGGPKPNFKSYSLFQIQKLKDVRYTLNNTKTAKEYHKKRKRKKAVITQKKKKKIANSEISRNKRPTAINIYYLLY